MPNVRGWGQLEKARDGQMPNVLETSNAMVLLQEERSVRKGSEGTHLIFMPTSKRYNSRGGWHRSWRKEKCAVKLLVWKKFCYAAGDRIQTEPMMLQVSEKAEAVLRYWKWNWEEPEEARKALALRCKNQTRNQYFSSGINIRPYLFSRCHKHQTGSNCRLNCIEKPWHDRLICGTPVSHLGITHIWDQRQKDSGLIHEAP